MLSARQTVALAERVLCERYPRARCGFAAGSLIRGDGTEGSDLDLIVLFATLPNASRRSFKFDGTAIEAFIHDPETLAWALKEDRRVGRPAMINMIAECRLVGPELEEGRRWRTRAKALLRTGPGPLSDERRDQLRYHVGDRIEDLRDPRTSAETIALGVSLFDPLAELALRSRGAWSANGKWIPKRLAALDPDLADAFSSAFEALFARHDPTAVIALAEAVSAPVGGLLFEGYESAWPPGNRVTTT
ncbi:MAG: hypothetical protein ACREEW_08230 [Caulobacteraceae bacterium]